MPSPTAKPDSVLKTDPPKGGGGGPAGEGIRSLETSGVFRAVNFELYAKPNKWIMGFGIVAITGYVLTMNYLISDTCFLGVLGTWHG